MRPRVIPAEVIIGWNILRYEIRASMRPRVIPAEVIQIDLATPAAHKMLQ